MTAAVSVPPPALEVAPAADDLDIVALPKMILKQCVASARHRRMVLAIYAARREAWRLDNAGEVPCWRGGKLVSLDRTTPDFATIIVLFDLLAQVYDTLPVIAFREGITEPYIIRVPKEGAT